MRHTLVIAMLMLLGLGVAYAQSDTCAPIVEQTLTLVGDACSELERNQACYGNVNVLPTFREDADAVAFEASGDTVDLVDLTALELSSLDVEGEEWGIAILNAQANVPDTLPGQNVTFVLFGDVELSAQAPGQEPEDSTLGSMEAFYFRTGIGDAPCAEAPDSGILVQTPEGELTINLQLNEVDIALGSTLFLQAEPEGLMSISVLEGEAEITALDETVTAPAGTAVSVELDEDSAPASPPTEPEPYDIERMRTLPIDLLPRAITLAEDEEGSTAGGDIPLQEGMWTPTFDLESPLFENCGNDLVGRQFVPPPFEVTTPDALEHFTGVMEELQSFGTTVTYELTNPEPNLFVITGTSGDLTFIFEYRVVSPERIETISYTPGDAGCTIVVPGVAEFTE